MLRTTEVPQEEREHESILLKCFKDRPWNPPWPSQCFLPDTKALSKSKGYALAGTFIYAKEMFEKKLLS